MLSRAHEADVVAVRGAGAHVDDHGEEVVLAVGIFGGVTCVCQFELEGEGDPIAVGLGGRGE